MTWPDAIGSLTAADVMHRHLTTLPASTTVAELRAYFAASGSRRLALVVDDGRYVGSIEASELPGDADGAATLTGHAVRHATIAPGASAAEARERGVAEPSRRIPVVDEAGVLLGIVAVTRTLDGFCGASAAD
jgi:CBS-domain-containing membrane protein